MVTGQVSTSREAADSIRSEAGRIRTRVLRCIAQRGLYGATCDEVEQLLGLRHQTCSARIWELHRKELLVRTSTKRKTRSGRNAFVYVLAEGGRRNV